MTEKQEAMYKDPAWLKKRSEIMTKQWRDKKYRANLIEKQKAMGLRGWTDLYYSSELRKTGRNVK